MGLPPMTALDLHALRREHGGTVYDGGRRWVGPGPGHSRRDASLSVWLAEQDRPIIYSFAGDTFEACARHLGLKPGEASQVDRATYARLKREREAARRRQEDADAAFCEGVWRDALPLAGSPAATYLRGRGLQLDHVADLRFHPAAPRMKPDPCRTPPAPLPAMVAVARDARGFACSLHTTSLRADGSGKAAVQRARLMFGRMSGRSVQLAPMSHDGMLAVAEGIETAASFTALHGVPAWAVLSTSGFVNFEPPAGIRRLIVAGDGDDTGASLRTATALAERVRERCDVEVRMAPAGRDWNDVLRGAA